MNNHKRGAPLKITPKNKKIKGKGKAPTKSASTSTAAKKKTPATNPLPTTVYPPITAVRKYTNWKQDPEKSALAHDVEAKLKGLDPKLSAGEIIIPYGTLRDHVRYAKEETKNRGVSLIIYLKDFARGKKNSHH